MIHSIDDIDGKISLENIKGKKILIDDFINPDEHMIIEKELVEYRNFPWYMGNGNVAGVNEEGWDHRDIYFYHVFFDRYANVSEWIPMIHPVINKLNPLALVRLRSNLDLGRSDHFHYGYHHDFDNIISAVYYVNSNNGGTLFKDGDFVQSKANRIVIFDSNLQHTSQTPTDVRARVLLNINYIPAEDERVMERWQV